MYTEELKILTQRGELPLGKEFSKKPVIVRYEESGVITIIPADVKPAISEQEILEGVERFKKEHSDAYRILKNE